MTTTHHMQFARRVRLLRRELAAWNLGIHKRMVARNPTKRNKQSMLRAERQWETLR